MSNTVETDLQLAPFTNKITFNEKFSKANTY